MCLNIDINPFKNPFKNFKDSFAFLIYGVCLCRLGAALSVIQQKQLDSSCDSDVRLIAEVLVRRVPDNQQVVYYFVCFHVMPMKFKYQ